MKFLQILFLIFSLSIFANAQKAILSDTVYDQQGAVISDAKVIVQNKNGKKFETLTDAEGKYKIDLPYTVYKTPDDVRTLPITRYTIKAVFTGFRITEIKEFVFTKPRVGNMQLDITLEVGLLGER
ncbi:MAG TPA: carboxypeptidase-like regulatory domain-containing protein [Pyrinomonadaceae bacterium]|nr:carboxypeptidase-like regulatory domain-containing protein [Pyrinomonadaceae bacterium]